MTIAALICWIIFAVVTALLIGRGGRSFNTFFLTNGLMSVSLILAIIFSVTVFIKTFFL